MNDKSVLRAQLRQRLSHHIQDFLRKNAKHLSLRLGRVSQRTQQIKDGTQADLFTRRCGIASGGMRRLGKQESNTDITDRAADPFKWQVNPYTQRFQHVRASAFRARRTIAMFGDARSGPRRDDRRGR